MLEALAGAGADGLSLSSLARGLGLNKSTAHRTLAALRARDYAEQDLSSGNYRLGPRPVLLVDRHLAEDGLQELLAPLLARVGEEAGELVHLGSLNLPWVIYASKVEPARAVRVWSQVGSRAPAATTALGRAFLACLPAVPFARLRLASPAVDEARLTEAVAAARRDGYAVEREENEPGVACVAVAVLRRGAPRAAVSVTAPAERLGPSRTAEVAAIMRQVMGEMLPPGLELPAGVAPNAD
jgi:DNA-binding IclR family transcriptional regulator